MRTLPARLARSIGRWSDAPGESVLAQPTSRPALRKINTMERGMFSSARIRTGQSAVAVI
jgi:hypothetical protein